MLSTRVQMSDARAAKHTWNKQRQIQTKREKKFSRLLYSRSCCCDERVLRLHFCWLLAWYIF